MIFHLATEHSVDAVSLSQVSREEGGDPVVAHVESGVPTVVVGAADVVAASPNPDTGKVNSKGPWLVGNHRSGYCRRSTMFTAIAVRYTTGIS